MVLIVSSEIYKSVLSTLFKPTGHSNIINMTNPFGTTCCFIIDFHDKPYKLITNVKVYLIMLTTLSYL